MQHRYAEYRRASWRHIARARVRPFRSVHLNPLGWTAAVLTVLTGAAVGYGGSRLADLPGSAGAVAGAVAVVAVLFAVDRRRWVSQQAGAR